MKKQLTTLTLTGLMIGPILGSGIILLPPIVYDLMGNLSILVWFIILALGFAFALVLGNLSIKFSGDEGVTNAVQEAFSTKLKFLTSYYLISAVFFGPVAVYLIGAHFLQPLLGINVNALAFSMLLFTFFALLRPVHFLGTLSLIVTTIIGIILSLGSIAILVGHETTFSIDSPFDMTLISRALLLAFWAIVGWEVVGNYSKEVHDPKRTIPKAVKISAVIISLIYLLVVCAIQCASLDRTNTITALIYPLFGTTSAFVMGILAMLLCLSTVLLFVGGVSRLISVFLSLMAANALAESAKNVDDTTEKNEASVLLGITVEDIRADGLRPETVEAGTFRGTNIMDVPSTVNVITKEALELQAATGTYDALRNTAGVTKQQNGGETWDQLVIRGIEVQNRTNYRLNGSLPLMNFSQVPLEDKERVEVLKGASALYYGFTSPAGIINYVTKRPTNEPMATVGLMMDQYGSAVGSADVSERFGEEKQVGVRVNAAGGTLGSYLDDVDNGNRSFVAMALDWQVNDRLSIKADVEHEHRQVTEQVGIALPKAVNGVITLPKTVDPTTLVGPDSSKFETETTNVLLRSDYALSDTWSLGLEAGRAKTQRERNLATFTFSNPQATTLNTGAGTVKVNHQEYEYTSDLLRAELYGVVNIGDIQHDLTFGTSYTEKIKSLFQAEPLRRLLKISIHHTP